MRKIVLIIFLLTVSKGIYCQLRNDSLNICEKYIRIGADYKYKYDTYVSLQTIKDSLISKQIQLNEKSYFLSKQSLEREIEDTKIKERKKIKRGLVVGVVIGFITGIIINN